MSLSGPVDGVQQLREALAGDLWKDLRHRAPDEVTLPEQFPVGLVDELEDVVGAAQNADESRRSFEQRALAFPLLLLRLAPQDGLGGLHAGAENAGDPALGVDDRAIGEGEPGAFPPALRGQVDLQVLEEALAALESLFDDRSDLVPDLGPDLQERPAQRLRMPAPEYWRIGVVVDEGAVGAPDQEHRKA